jgi:hypothetical protein
MHDSVAPRTTTECIIGPWRHCRSQHVARHRIPRELIQETVFIAVEELALCVSTATRSL